MAIDPFEKNSPPSSPAYDLENLLRGDFDLERFLEQDFNLGTKEGFEFSAQEFEQRSSEGILKFPAASTKNPSLNESEFITIESFSKEPLNLTHIKECLVRLHDLITNLNSPHGEKIKSFIYSRMNGRWGMTLNLLPEGFRNWLIELDENTLRFVWKHILSIINDETYGKKEGVNFWGLFNKFNELYNRAHPNNKLDLVALYKSGSLSSGGVCDEPRSVLYFQKLAIETLLKDLNNRLGTTFTEKSLIDIRQVSENRIYFNAAIISYSFGLVTGIDFGVKQTMGLIREIKKHLNIVKDGRYYYVPGFEKDKLFELNSEKLIVFYSDQYLHELHEPSAKRFDATNPVQNVRIEKISKGPNKEAVREALEKLQSMLDPKSKWYNKIYRFISEENAGYWGFSYSMLKELREWLFSLDEVTLEFILNNIFLLATHQDCSQLEKAYKKQNPGKTLWLRTKNIFKKPASNLLNVQALMQCQGIFISKILENLDAQLNNPSNNDPKFLFLNREVDGKFFFTPKKLFYSDFGVLESVSDVSDFSFTDVIIAQLIGFRKIPSQSGGYSFDAELASKILAACPSRKDCLIIPSPSIDVGEGAALTQIAPATAALDPRINRGAVKKAFETLKQMLGSPEYIQRVYLVLQDKTRGYWGLTIKEIDFVKWGLLDLDPITLEYILRNVFCLVHHPSFGDEGYDALSRSYEKKQPEGLSFSFLSLAQENMHKRVPDLSKVPQPDQLNVASLIFIQTTFIKDLLRGFDEWIKETNVNFKSRFIIYRPIENNKLALYPMLAHVDGLITHLTNLDNKEADSLFFLKDWKRENTHTQIPYIIKSSVEDFVKSSDTLIASYDEISSPLYILPASLSRIDPIGIQKSLKLLDAMLKPTFLSYPALREFIETKNNSVWGMTLNHFEWKLRVELLELDPWTLEYALTHLFCIVHDDKIKDQMYKNFDKAYKQKYPLSNFDLKKIALANAGQRRTKGGEATVDLLLWAQREMIDRLSLSPWVEKRTFSPAPYFVFKEMQTDVEVASYAAVFEKSGLVKCIKSSSVYATLFTNLSEFISQNAISQDRKTYLSKSKFEGFESALKNRFPIYFKVSAKAIENSVREISQAAPSILLIEANEEAVRTCLQNLLVMLDRSSPFYDELLAYIREENGGEWGLTLEHLGEEMKKLLITSDEVTVEFLYNKIFCIGDSKKEDYQKLNQAFEAKHPGKSFDFEGHAKANRKSSAQKVVPPELSAEALLFLQRSIARWKLKSPKESNKTPSAPLFIFHSGIEGLYLTPLQADFRDEWVERVGSISDLNKTDALLTKILGTKPAREGSLYILKEEQKEILFKYLEGKKEEEMPFILISRGSLLMRDEKKSDPVVQNIDIFHGIEESKAEEELFSDPEKSIEPKKKRSAEEAAFKESKAKRDKKKKVEAEESLSLFAALSRQGIQNLQKTLKNKGKEEEEIGIKDLSALELFRTPIEPVNRTYIDGKLKFYQRLAVNRILELNERGLQGALLALDTGLGKTRTMIETAGQLLLENSHDPLLFIATKSTIMQIEHEFLKHVGQNYLSKIREEVLRVFQGTQINDYKYQYYVVSKLIKEGTALHDKLSKEKNPHQNKIKTIKCLIDEATKLQDALIEKGKEIKLGWAHLELTRFSVADLEKDLKEIISQKKDFRIDLFSRFFGDKMIFLTLEGIKKYTGKAPQAIFIDEAHHIHNDETKKYEDLIALIRKDSLKKPFVILSTATPFQNDLRDLFTYLSLITDTPAQKLEIINESFKKEIAALAREFRDYRKAEDDIEKAECIETITEGTVNLLLKLEELKALLAKLTYMVKKTDPEIIAEWGGALPKTTYKYVDLTFDHQPQQQEVIKEIDVQFTRAVRQNQSSNFLRLKAKFAGAFIHPRLGENYENVISFSNESSVLSYFIENKELVARSFTEGGAVFFVERLEAGRLLQALLKEHYQMDGVDFLYGQLSEKERERMIQRFEAPFSPGEKKAMIISVEAGREGIDFSKNGKTAYMLFGCYNPAAIEQTENRIVRAGSLKERVEIVFFRCNAHMEQHTQWHIERKKRINEFLFDPKPLSKENFNKHLKDLIATLGMHLTYTQYLEMKPLFSEIAENVSLFAAQDKELVIRRAGAFKASLSPKIERQTKKRKAEENERVVKPMLPKPAHKEISAKLAKLNEEMTKTLDPIGGPLATEYVRKGKKYHILPMRTSLDARQSNYQRVLYAGSNLLDQAPIKVGEIITALKNHPENALQARISTTGLLKNDQPLHHLLWDTLQLNHRAVNEGAFRIAIYDSKGNKALNQTSKALSKIRMLKSVHPNGTEHYDLLAPKGPSILSNEN